MKTSAIFTCIFLISAGIHGAASQKQRQRQQRCRRIDEGDFTVIRSASRGGDIRRIERSFDAFKDLLGGKDNGSGPSSRRGFRTINWDADAVPFNMRKSSLKD